MIEKGIRLLPEVDAFEDTSGCLLSHLQPTNTADVDVVTKQYRHVIQAIMKTCIDQIRVRHPEHTLTHEQQRVVGWSIHAIRRSHTKFYKRAHHDLRAKLPWLRRGAQAHAL